MMSRAFRIAESLTLVAALGSLTVACSADGGSRDSIVATGGDGGSGVGTGATGGVGTGATGGTGVGGAGTGATGGDIGTGATGGDIGTGATGGDIGTGATGGDIGTGATGGGAGAPPTGGTGGTGGVVGDPFEATAVPTGTGLINFTMGNVIFEVDANQAGKITTFSIDGTDVLVDAGANNGSVFWPSPQSWGWPPPVEWDSSPYTVSQIGNVIEMVGPNWANQNTSVTKRFWANEATQIVTIEYVITNNGTGAVQVAPWEVTRVNTGGLLFFPENAAYPHYDWTNPPIPLTAALGAAWFAYTDSGISGSPKSGGDASAGWAAHVHCGVGLQRACAGGDSPILIKQWADVTSDQFAPSETELEIYADAAHTYVEFENQGAYTSIPAGGTLTWTMRWYLRTVPATITPLIESQALLDWVAGVLY